MPAASEEGPSAGGRLRRWTVEDQSLRQKTRAILMKNDPTPRLPPTRTTSVGQVGHRRRAMSAASRLPNLFFQRSPCHVVCLPG